MVTYVEAANTALRTQLQTQDSTVVMGQNVDAGSRLAGLASSFSAIPSVSVINSTNSENSLVGCGFGLMLRDQPSLLLLKQEDFLLLGVDQLVNTWNLVRGSRAFVPFVIGVIVVDSGWEGAQSSFNNTCAIASLARIPWYTPSGHRELQLAAEAAFSGGPRLLAFSQRLFRQDLRVPADYSSREGPGYVSHAFPARLSASAQVVVFSINFSLPYCMELADRWRSHRGWDITVISLFEGPIRLDQALDELIDNADLVVIVSDEKSLSPTNAEYLERLVQTRRQASSGDVVVCRRVDFESWSLPSPDDLDLSILEDIVL